MIAIIGAMEIEVNALKAKLDAYEEQEIMNIKVIVGKVGQEDVVLALSGVGKVNAAMTTAVLLQSFNITCVINIGTAGGLLETQNVLDIVIGENCIQHDFDTTTIDGEAGRGIVSTSDNRLIKIAEKVLASETHKVWLGDIASGDVFVSELAKVEAIKSYFPNVIACEMEAGAIAYVCNFQNIPCIILRSLSDNAYHTNSEMDFKSYAVAASERSARFCITYIEELVKS